MTRSERLKSQGMTDTMYYGTVALRSRRTILADRNTCYLETDEIYNVDIYERLPDGMLFACEA